MRGLGSVKEIHDTNVVLECAEGIQVTVNCSRISQKFSELLSKKEVSFTLDEIFKVGQLLAFKVVKSASKEGDLTRNSFKVFRASAFKKAGS